MIDSYGRKITYLRLSVTDRCDLRCTYCMPSKMTFLARRDLLTLEEIYSIATIFVASGVSKIRITGGEPLIRKNILSLFERLHFLKKNSTLREICLTTNATMLSLYAKDLKKLGVDRINISLDSLNENTFSKLTRSTKFDQVMKGIESAKIAGLKIKLNTVALNKINSSEFANLLNYCISNNLDITFIEVMPMGDIGNEARLNSYLPLSEVLNELSRKFELDNISYSSGGPANYYQVKGSTTKVGFITTLSNNFCKNCNRVRLTCTGILYSCLGHDNNVNLLKILRENPAEMKNGGAQYEKQKQALLAGIEKALKDKPLEHNFVKKSKTGNLSSDHITYNRHMNTTGG